MKPTNLKLMSLVALVALPLLLVACGGGESPKATSAATARNGAGGPAGTHEGSHGPEGSGAEGDSDDGSHGDDDEHDAKRGHVRLSAQQMQAAGIDVAQVGPADIRSQLSLYGVIAPNAERVRDVAARFPGVIVTVAKRVGEPVKQGEVLATVESNESLQTYNVVTPLAGVVTARQANAGEQTRDHALFTVADLSTVWVELSLFPRDLPKVRPGQSVRVKSTDANLVADGKVVYVAPFGTSTSQTLTARVLLENADRKWAPGLYVIADITVGSASVPLAISSQALQTLEEQNVVFVQGDAGFEPRSIRLGRSDGERTEVLAGLNAGDAYATKNSFILKAELGKGEASHDH
jgi:cobalt-zinc-cadmium efflux system membrane fusion protein